LDTKKPDSSLGSHKYCSMSMEANGLVEGAVTRIWIGSAYRLQEIASPLLWIPAERDHRLQAISEGCAENSER
jgi:hypothetical protein